MLTALALARSLAADVRSLAHGAYLKHAVAKPIGFQEMISEFNTTRGGYSEAVLSLRVHGPSWAIAPGESIEILGQKWTKLLTEMINGVTNDQIRLVEFELPRLDAEVDAFIAVASGQLNADAAALPERPSREASFDEKDAS